MNKKIKVIELFDIIAKGIDIPARVEYCGKIYKFDSEEMDYIGLGDGSCLSLKVMSFDNLGEALNSEIEILEDEKEIDIQDIQEVDTAIDPEGTIIDTRMDTLNQVIKAVKQLDKKINKE